jgi:putative transposase
MSELYQSLSHSKWDCCKYHVVFVPKRRRKAIFGQTRCQLGQIFHGLARQKECQILEGHLMPDHVHMCIAISPKHPVASVIGFLKGKSAIAIARLCRKERNFSGALHEVPRLAQSLPSVNSPVRKLKPSTKP